MIGSNELIKRLREIEDELIRLRKQRNYELNNLDEDNIPRLRQYSQIISENQAAVSLVEQKVSDVESSVTLLSQYTSFDNVVVVEASDDKTNWDKTRVYYDKTAKIYYYYDGKQWLTTSNPVTAGLDTAIAQIQAKTAENEAEISLVAQSVTQNTQAITGLETLTGQIDGEINTVKTNFAAVETKADDAAASAELAAQSVTELESEVSGQIKTLTQNVASVKTTADSASASVSAIVKNVGANGAVTAASIVAKINSAGSSVQISADHISLKGKTIALTADEIDIASTYFNVTKAGAVACSSISVSGVNSVIDISGNSETTAKSTVRYNGASYPYSYQIPQGFVAMGSNSSGYSYPNSTTHNGYVNGYNSSVEAGYAILSLGCNMWSRTVFFADVFNNQVTVGGQFTCYGLKSRAEQTEHYRDRLMYAFETPNPLYGDFGRATIAEDGICYIFLDPIFYECIDNTCDYYVFIQPEGEGQFTVIERASDHFKVQGMAGQSFAWMLVTAQKGYSATRNEEIVPPEPEPENIPNTENSIYDALGDDILREFESQLG